MTDTNVNAASVLFSAQPARGWLPWGALAPLLCILFVLLPAILTLWPMAQLGLMTADEDPIGAVGLIAFLFIPFALTGVLVLAWTLLVERRPLATIGLTQTGAGVWLGGAAIGAAGILGIVLASWLAGGFAAQAYFPAVRQPQALAAIGVLFLAFAVQAGVEELVFRGWLLSVTARKFGLAAAIAINALVFTLLHFSPGLHWLAILNLLLFAGFACAWAVRANNIWGVMGWHAGWNWLLATGFEVPVTGLDAHQPALLVRLLPIGPDILTGGAQGPEGSLFCTLFFAVGIALLARSIRRRSRAI